ncbi:hypothetical protein ACWCQL_29230 [Streptomyces sp. NPDC002073]
MSGGTEVPGGDGIPEGPGGRGGRLDSFVELVAPEQASAGKGWKYALLSLIAGLVFAGLVTGVFEEGWARLWERNRAVREEKIADALEGEKAPFAAKIWRAMPEKEPHQAFVLDRRLTASEQQTLRRIEGSDLQATWDFVRARGGRRILNDAADYRLQLTSERQKAVVITSLAARASRCYEPRQATYITDNTGGLFDWDGVGFELKPGKESPAVAYADIRDERDFPKYDKAIVLGGTNSPGLLNIRPMGPQNDISCEFEIILTYNIDSGPSHRHVITTDERGKPLLFEGYPHGRTTDQWRTALGETWKPAAELAGSG